jgi:hypothetical protein
MPHVLVYRASVAGVFHPRRSLKPITDAWLAWCAEQGLDEHRKDTESVEIYQDERGQLTAHFIKRDVLSEQELAAKRAKLGTDAVGRVKVYGTLPGGKLDTRTHVEKHPVTSIKILLDDLDAVGASA